MPSGFIHADLPKNEIQIWLGSHNLTRMHLWIGTLGNVKMLADFCSGGLRFIAIHWISGPHHQGELTMIYICLWRFASCSGIDACAGSSLSFRLAKVCERQLRTKWQKESGDQSLLYFLSRAPSPQLQKRLASVL